MSRRSAWCHTVVEKVWNIQNAPFSKRRTISIWEVANFDVRILWRHMKTSNKMYWTQNEIDASINLHASISPGDQTLPLVQKALDSHIVIFELPDLWLKGELTQGFYCVHVNIVLKSFLCTFIHTQNTPAELRRRCQMRFSREITTIFTFLPFFHSLRTRLFFK